MNGLSRNNSSSDLRVAGGAAAATANSSRAGTPQPQRNSRGNPLMRLAAACDSSMSVASAPPKPKGDWDELFATCKNNDLERQQKATGGEQQQQQQGVTGRRRTGSV